MQKKKKRKKKSESLTPGELQPVLFSNTANSTIYQESITHSAM